MFKVGDKCKLRKDVLQRHATSVPAYLGYTPEQFKWRDILSKFDEITGEIKYIFPDTEYVNVIFPDNTIIGIYNTELDHC